MEKIKLIISGCNGHMGRTVSAIIAGDPDVDVVAGIDINSSQSGGYPVFASPSDFPGEADALIDFSSSEALAGLLEFGLSKNIPLVLCTTGYSAEQLADIEKAALKTPVFRSGNMSLGINLLMQLVKKASAVLGDAFDVEVVERHHRRKVDAPSGTAIMLAEAASASLPYGPEYVYERQSVRKARAKEAIGISSVRGGTIVGDHEVIFAGLDEVIELRHSAASRDVFAVGAVRAAKFMAGVDKPGLYNMADVLF